MWSDSFYNVSCYSMDFIIRPGRLRLLGFEIEIVLVVFLLLYSHDLDDFTKTCTVLGLAMIMFPS